MGCSANKIWNISIMCFEECSCDTIIYREKIFRLISLQFWCSVAETMTLCEYDHQEPAPHAFFGTNHNQLTLILSSSLLCVGTFFAILASITEMLQKSDMIWRNVFWLHQKGFLQIWLWIVGPLGWWWLLSASHSCWCLQIKDRWASKIDCGASTCLLLTFLEWTKGRIRAQ